MNSFLTVGQQVLILFILIAVGVLANKTKLLSEESAKGLSNVVLYCVTPCILIKSFVDIPFSTENLKDLFLVLFIAFLMHGGMILLSKLLVHDSDDARQRMLRFAVIFSNAGYMGLPLQEALLGDEGAFLCGAYIAAFNAMAWSYGVILMSGDRKSLSPKKILLSPGLLGVGIGLLLFLMPLVWKDFALPELIFAPIRHLAALNTPLPMIVVGFYLADIDFKAVLHDLKSFYVVLLRIVVMPLLTFGILYVCGLRGSMLVSLVISASTPVAAMTTMFAAKYDRYPHTSGNIVSLSTLLSILTMPLIVGFAEMVA